MPLSSAEDQRTPKWFCLSSGYDSLEVLSSCFSLPVSANSEDRQRSTSSVLGVVQYLLLDTLRQVTEQKPEIHFELWFLSTDPILDFFGGPQHTRSPSIGFFSGVYLAPSASTWSRVRHCSSPGQPPLRSRSEPLGSSRLHPPARERVDSATAEVEVCCWFTEQALACSKRFVFVFPCFLRISAETR